MNCSESMIEYMHDFLDEEISAENEAKLREHLSTCPECNRHFHELKKSIAFVQSTSHIQAPANFTANVMARLPKEKKQVGVKRWFRHHPMITAASLFLVLMLGSFISGWNQNHEFTVSKYPNLVIENNTVIIPEGETVKGDLVVKNGDIKIEGKVNGDVTVINGEKYLASAGQVTGDIEEVNQLFDWIWYHMKKAAKDTIQLFSE
ncbi:anti-sigma-W factor RsiW [Neobacillus sp. D3-1R]|uniref:anti-sigma-W factor RsiW n=1 Tax=Neobacillus sp. D3-1R TaxID=3445778 RepID=UPI003F9F5B2E